MTDNIPGNEKPKMSRRKAFGIAALAALVWLVLTGIIGFSDDPFVGERIQSFCISFHLVPFGIGFTGGSPLLVLAYYLVAWLLLSAMIFAFIPKQPVR